MQYQVPQFINVENRIVGFLTLKQFLYIAAAGAISFLLFFALQVWLWLIITAILLAIAAALAFVKINSQPLPGIIARGIMFYWKPKLYLWQREVEEKMVAIPGEGATEMRERLKQLLPESANIKKLWQNLLTTKTPIPKREKSLKPPGWGRKPKEKFEVMRKLTREKEMARRIDYR